MQSEVKEEVCDFDNLYKAMRHCRKEVMWKDSVAGYVKNGLVNVHKLKESLEDGTYKIDRYTEFKVYEPKERDIVSTRIKDRVFQRSLCDHYFYDAMSNSFIYDNCACQIGKGNDFARDRLKVHLLKYFREHKNNGYVLKADLTNYFGSTPHELAYNSVTKRCSDEWCNNHVHTIISSFTQGNDPSIGMGLGSETTQLIELAVLDDLDHFIKEQLHIRHYLRYMDDLVLIHEDKEYLKSCLEQIRDWVESRGLRLSSKKTQLFPLQQGIKFLGFRFRLSDTGKVVMTLLPEKVSHERRKLRKLVARSRAGWMSREEVDNCYKAWKAHAKKGNCHTLILSMDKYYTNLWR